MCPWHAWEYSVVTGKGPPGYEEEAVPVFAVEDRADGVYLDTDPIHPRRLVRHEPHPLTVITPRPAGAPPRVLGLSTTAMDEANPRFSTSDHLLEAALHHAARRISRRRPASSGCGNCRSGPARGTTPRRPTRVPGPAPSPNAIRPTS